MKLEQDKEELDKQLRQTQEAVLAGKQRVEKLREEVQRRTEARTVGCCVPGLKPETPSAFEESADLSCMKMSDLQWAAACTFCVQHNRCCVLQHYAMHVYL